LPRTFSMRDVCRSLWALLSDREQVAAALRLLCDLDWLAVFLRYRRATGNRLPGQLERAVPMSYLERLKANFPEKALPKVVPKVLKDPSVTFGTDQGEPVSEIEAPQGDATVRHPNLSGVSPEFTARLSAEDVNDIAAGDIPVKTVQAFEAAGYSQGGRGPQGVLRRARRHSRIRRRPTEARGRGGGHADHGDLCPE
jgi:hypothetical protein